MDVKSAKKEEEESFWFAKRIKLLFDLISHGSFEWTTLTLFVGKRCGRNIGPGE